jgi:hypothetical protein
VVANCSKVSDWSPSLAALFWLRMHLHQQAVGANHYHRARQNRNRHANARGMVGINDHWETTHSFEYRHGRHIEGVTRGCFKGADPALARLTSEFPHSTRNCAERDKSSKVAAMPRFKSTGRPQVPSRSSREKFSMLRAPTCTMSAYSATSSTSVSDMTSVMIARRV